jgi:2,3-bisphosphoglycerate-independent phosphoglycerate mutase
MHRLLLLILDGWGISNDLKHNPILQTRTPYWDHCLDTYPNGALHCREDSVGLSHGHLSNSEVGHTAIGAGRVVPQSAFAIDQAIKNRSFFENDVLTQSKQHLEKHTGALHLIGMLSDKGVHSHIDHLIALIEWAQQQDVKDIVLHLFLDGRDMAPMSATTLFPSLEPYLSDTVRIATICGRSTAMDRTENWNRTTNALKNILNNGSIIPSPRRGGLGRGSCSAENPSDFIQSQYKNNITDEFIQPACFTDDTINTGDAIIFFNFRADRMKQMIRLFTGLAPRAVQKNIAIPDNLFLASIANYDASFSQHVRVLFPKQTPKNNLGEWISKQGLTQLRLTETEKQAHVTYFINGSQDIQYKNEERLIIPSLGLTNYAQHPEMGLPEITTSLTHALTQKHFDLIIANIPNGDMLGHTGDIEAAKKAVTHVDHTLSQIIPIAESHNYTVLITSDHGNIESMWDDDQPHTAHTNNEVPIIITNPNISVPKTGFLNQVAPTALTLMNLPIPPEMKACSLT